jgi:hypothetical protein
MFSRSRIARRDSSLRDANANFAAEFALNESRIMLQMHFSARKYHFVEKKSSKRHKNSLFLLTALSRRQNSDSCVRRAIRAATDS